VLIAKNQWLKTEKVRLENNRYNSALVWDILIAQNGASGFISNYKTGQPGDFLKNALKTVTYSVGTGIMNQFGLSKVQYLDEIKTFYGTEFYNSLMTNLLMDFYSLSSYYRLSEHHIYGSSRLGTREVKLRMLNIDEEGNVEERFGEMEDDLYFYRGFKRYEMVSHTNSVLVVISDKRTPVCDVELGVSYFEAEVLAAYDYAPFGMMLPERTWSSDSVSYKYGFNTQEKDDEIYGAGNSYTAEYWQYDSRLGRRWNVDPRGVPSFSPYSCFANNPIWFSDEYGDSASSQSTSPVQDVVNKGEGPAAIAQRNGITLDELAKRNPTVFKNYENAENKSEYWKNAEKNWVIHPGQKLNVRSNEPSNNLWEPPMAFTQEQMRQMYPQLFEVSSGKVESMDFFEIPLTIVESAFNAVGVNENYSGLIASIPFILINPKAFYKSASKIVIARGASSILSQITPKIAKQMGGRGWTKELVHGTVNNPFTTRLATNKATGNAATAFFTKEGSYVVRDNVTGQIIQVSNRLDPKWIPDASIINPYIPK
jgi:RHS repeat-associated protein